jgi:hypothetical protein
MRTRSLQRISILLAITLGAGLTLFGISQGWAQEKRRISYKWTAENTKYTQQYVIDVADVPGHQIRIYEILRTWPNNPPAFNGVQVKEERLSAISDYIDINGRSWGYYYYILENGDKIFARFDGTSQTIVNPDGSKKSSFTAVITLTDGTGKSRGIRGIGRYMAVFDPKAGLNEGQVEGEYWIAK